MSCNALCFRDICYIFTAIVCGGKLAYLPEPMKTRQLDKKHRVHPQFMASQQQYDDPWEREIKRMRHARIRQVGDRPFHVTPHHRSVMMREQRLAQSNCSSHGPYMPSQVISATGKWEPHKTKHKWLGQAWKAPNRMQRAPGE